MASRMAHFNVTDYNSLRKLAMAAGIKGASSTDTMLTGLEAVESGIGGSASMFKSHNSHEKKAGSKRKGSNRW